MHLRTEYSQAIFQSSEARRLARGHGAALDSVEESIVQTQQDIRLQHASAVYYDRDRELKGDQLEHKCVRCTLYYEEIATRSDKTSEDYESTNKPWADIMRSTP